LDDFSAVVTGFRTSAIEAKDQLTARTGASLEKIGKSRSAPQDLTPAPQNVLLEVARKKFPSA
jgi:hypothetical protein